MSRRVKEIRIWIESLCLTNGIHFVQWIRKIVANCRQIKNKFVENVTANGSNQMMPSCCQCLHTTVYRDAFLERKFDQIWRSCYCTFCYCLRTLPPSWFPKKLFKLSLHYKCSSLWVEFPHSQKCNNKTLFYKWNVFFSLEKLVLNQLSLLAVTQGHRGTDMSRLRVTGSYNKSYNLIVFVLFFVILIYFVLIFLFFLTFS